VSCVRQQVRAHPSCDLPLHTTFWLFFSDTCFLPSTSLPLYVSGPELLCPAGNIRPARSFPYPDVRAATRVLPRKEAEVLCVRMIG